MSTATRSRRAYDFCLMTDFGRRLRLRSCALAILLALILQPATPARAACDVDGMIDAMAQAAKTAGICMGVCGEGDQYTCYAAAGLAIFLVEMRKTEGQDKVDLFCNSVNNTLAAITDKVVLIQQIMDLLQSMGVETSNYSDTLSGAAQDVATALAIVNCACATENLQIKNQDSFGACLNELAEKLGCGSFDWSTGTLPDCDPIGAAAGDALNWGEQQIHRACCKLEVPFCSCDAGHEPGWWNSYCEPGYQSDAAGNCLPCDKTNIQHVVTLGNGRCGCDTLYTPQYHVLCLDADCTNTQQILDSCTCKPPREEKNGHCLCPKGQQQNWGGTCVECAANEKYIPYSVDAKGVAHLPSCGQCPLPDIVSDDGLECVFPYNCDPKAGQVPDPGHIWQCKTCGDHQRAADNDLLYKYRCEDCKTGEKVSADHLQCDPACDGSKNEYFEVKSGSCKTCADYQRVAYSGKRGAVGVCINCDVGQKGSNDQSQCIPKCGPGQVVAPPDNTVKPITVPLAPGTLPGPTDQTAPGPASDATLAPNAALFGGAKSSQGPATISDPDPGKVVVNEALLASLCKTCPENTYARHDVKDSSIGTCEPCADGTHSYAGAVECIPLNCGAAGYQDPDNPNACKYCPASQIYIHAEKKVVKLPGGKSRVEVVPGHCGCGAAQKLVDGKCVCAAGTIMITQPGLAGPPILAGCVCPEGATLDAATFSCKCPSGAKLDASGRSCVCAVGSRLENGKCVPPSVTRLPLARKDCAAVGAAFINDPKNAARCVRCPGNSVPNSDRTACVAKPSTTIMTPKREGTGGKPRRGETWLNPQPEPPRPVRSCPPHMTQNLRGTGCVPVLDMPGFGAPGSMPSGAGRTGPAGGPAAVGPMRR